MQLRTKTLIYTAGLAVIFVMTGCSGKDKIISNKKVDYKSSRKAKSLEVPPDLTKPNRDNTMAVPDISPSSGSATYSEYSRERSPKRSAFDGSASVLPKQDKVRFERRGNKYWVVMKGTPAQVWPHIRNFWVEHGFVLTLDNPTIGIMETDWAENRASIPNGPIRRILGKVFSGAYSSGTLDRFRVRLEPGSESHTTEIYLSHKGMKEEVMGHAMSPEGTSWIPRKRDAELEIEMLKRLMVHIGLDKHRARHLARKATKSRPVVTARMTRSNKGPLLVVNESFSKAWRITGLALDRTGFTVEDRDRTKGIYYVRYQNLDKTTRQKGLLSKFKFWKKKKKEGIKQSLYQVHVFRMNKSTSIMVRNKDGQAEKSKTSKRILAVLHENLK